MSEHRLLVTDIDGTLTPTGGGGPNYDIYPTQLAFSQAYQAGKRISLATGRPLEWTHEVIHAFGITSPVIVNNGARVSSPTTGKTLWEKLLPLGAGEKIHSFLGELAAVQNSRVSLDHSQEHALRALTIGVLQESVYFDLIGIPNQADALAIAAFVDELDETSCSVVASPQLPGGHNILVTHAEGTKYHGMRALQNLLGISEAETIAAGNDVNDAPLLEAAGLSVAVEDSDPRLIAIADMVIPSPWHYGLAQLVQTHLAP